ncbi:MAG: MoxR family ATPase [Deltaproteobacteria bacterium]|nr:MoxR family ATPase [Deltaproteobacteria bacterium]
METAADRVERLKDEISRVVVGQRGLIDGLLIALLCGGHALVEGVPGLAKTTAIRTLAKVLGLGFGRIQFTPDLLPGDLVGTPVYVPDQRNFIVRRGPIFTPVLLADEINRAPAKVQSALLEAMEEAQVTIGEETFALPQPFFVMATQNPVDLEGTYPLPEAQIDRFLVKLVVPYPSAEDERAIVARDHEEPPEIRAVADAAVVEMLQRTAAEVHVDPVVSDYAVRLVRATRDLTAAGVQVNSPIRPDGPGEGDAMDCVALGASPRASMYLVRAARARAFMDGRDYATPYDVKRMAPDVLRHRVMVTYEAEADGIRPEDVINAILATVETP